MRSPTHRAFVGGIDPKQAIDLSYQTFRGLPFDQLQEEDLRYARQQTGRAAGDVLAMHSRVARFGEVDAFVSHSWNDDHVQRYQALKRWADEFEYVKGRMPLIWLDKALA